jgi:hypothetical protein
LLLQVITSEINTLLESIWIWADSAKNGMQLFSEMTDNINGDLTEKHYEVLCYDYLLGKISALA